MFQSVITEYSGLLNNFGSPPPKEAITVECSSVNETVNWQILRFRQHKDKLYDYKYYQSSCYYIHIDDATQIFEDTNVKKLCDIQSFCLSDFFFWFQ